MVKRIKEMKKGSHPESRRLLIENLIAKEKSTCEDSADKVYGRFERRKCELHVHCTGGWTTWGPFYQTKEEKRAQKRQTNTNATGTQQTEIYRRNEGWQENLKERVPKSAKNNQDAQ